MDLVLHSNNVHIPQHAKNLLNQKSKSLSHRLGRYNTRNRQLIANFNQDEHGGVEIQLKLELEGEILHVAKRKPNIPHGIKDAMRAMYRQFDRWRLHRNPNLQLHVKRRRRARQDNLDLFARAEFYADEAASAEKFRDLYTSLLRIATHEIAEQQADANIEPGYLDPVEIVDQVMVNFLAEIKKSQNEPWQLKQRGRRLIAEQIHKILSAEEELSEKNLSLDLDVPESSESLELSSLGDEILDFWVVDEDMLMADMIGDPHAKTPEEIVGDREGRKALLNALLRIPADSRYVFGAIAMDNESPKDLANYLGYSEDRVMLEFDLASKRLARIISGPDHTYSPGEVKNIYSELGEKFRVDVVRLARTAP